MADSIKLLIKSMGQALVSAPATRRWVASVVCVAVGTTTMTQVPNAWAQAQAPAPAPAPAAANAPKLNAQQLDSLTAPIALYPDALLAQVLMATTFPDDLAAAAQWSHQNPKLQGDDAVKAVSATQWDPSVQSLVAFPQVLATMAQKPDWVNSIGQAFLAQPNDVMDSVQRLRTAAYKAGNLQSSQQQKVVVQPASGTTTQTIVIEQPSPQVVYVPTYNPTVVYGAWPYPAYPPVYMPPPPGYVVGTALVAGLAFGAGIAITNSLWGGCDWGHGDVNVNVNRYNNINVNHHIDANRSTSSWDRTNAVNARNRAAANGGINRPGGPNGNNLAGNRDAYRGRDGAQRDQARNALSERTGQNMNGSASDRLQNIRQGGGANGGPGGGNRPGAGGAGTREGGPGGNNRPGAGGAGTQGGGLGGNRPGAGGAGTQGGGLGGNRPGAGGAGTQGGGLGGNNRPGGDVNGRAQNVNRDNALRDAGNGGASRQSMDRGQQSRAAAGGGAGGGGGFAGRGGGGHAGGRARR